MVAKEIYEYVKSQVGILNSLISFKDEYQSLPIDIDVQQVREVCQACQGMPDSLQRS